MAELDRFVRSSGKDLNELAELSGIDRGRLDSIVAGESASLGELRRLAKALGRRVQDLVRDSSDFENAEMLFRSAVSAPDGRVANSLTDFSQRAASALGILRAHREVPAWLAAFAEDSHETLLDAERDASRLRSILPGVDSLSPLFALPQHCADTLGITLFVVPGDHVDGASALVDGRPFIFLAARTFKPRMLFTLAHEIGHLVAHHSRGDDVAFVDVEGFESSPSRSGGERYANAFAQCLLLPAAGVGVAIGTLRRTFNTAESEQLGDIEINALARIFGVSFEVAARRCEDLGLLDSGGARSLTDAINSDFGSAERRGEAAGLPERPDVEFPSVPTGLFQVASEMVRTGRISIGRAAEALGTTVSDFVDTGARA